MTKYIKIKDDKSYQTLITCGIKFPFGKDVIFEVVRKYKSGNVDIKPYNVVNENEATNVTIKHEYLKHFITYKKPTNEDKIKEIIVQEGILDKIINHVDKVINDKDVKQLSKQLEKDDPQLAQALKKLETSFNEVTELWNDFDFDDE